MFVLIFVAIIIAWSLFLGRFMGGTGTWLPTGGQPVSPDACAACAVPGHSADQCPVS